MYTANEKISFKNIVKRLFVFIRLLKDKYKQIIGVGVIFSLLGLCLSLISKPEYTARLTFSLDEEKGGGALAGYIGVASQLGIDLGSSGGSVFTGENIIELIKSRLVIENTLISKISIDGIENTFADHFLDRFGWRQKLDKKGLDKLNFRSTNRKEYTREQDSVLYLIFKSIQKQNLTVFKVDKKLSIYNVVFTSSDEAFSGYFIDAIMGEVTKLYIDNRTKKSRSMVSILEQKTDSVKFAYESALMNVAVYNDANRNIAKQIVLSVAAKRQMETQLLATYYAELVKHLETAKISLMKETPLIQKIDTPIFPLEKKKIGKLKGGVIGMFIGLFLSSLFIIIRFSFTQIMNEVDLNQ